MSKERSSLAEVLGACAGAVEPCEVLGSVLGVEASTLRIYFPGCSLQALLAIDRELRSEPLLGRVVAIEGGRCTVSPLGSTHGVRVGASVRKAPQQTTAALGPHLLGAALNSHGQIAGRFFPEDRICGKLRSLPAAARELCTPAPRALVRRPIDAIFETGVRAIDAFVTVGRGQRLGIFAEPGVGKSSLLGAMLDSAGADIIVVSLIGERGREVREFIERFLGPGTQARSTLIFSTSEEPPLARINAALVSLTLAEYFRDAGMSVLLLVDSLTRLCRAYREIGLIAGEPPARRGYPHSVFARLPEFLERAGNSDRGSITAMYTVLLSGELEEDPMVEEIKSLTDGHIMLRRQIAESGRYPAIDVPRSVSRLQNRLIDPEMQAAAMSLRALLSRLDRDRELVLFGGSPDEDLRRALQLEPGIVEFLRQSPNETVRLNETRRRLIELCRREHPER